MSQYPGGYEDAAMKPKSGMGTGGKIAIGCLVIFVLLVIGCAIGGWVLWNKYGKVFAQYFEDYVPVQGQSFTVNETITQPTLYQAETVTINGDSHADLAFLGQSAIIHGTVHGNVDILAMEGFTLAEGGIIDGNIHVPVAVQTITISSGAVVTGDITGLVAESVVVEEGAIVGGQITITVETRNVAPGAKVGEGIPDDIRALIDASAPEIAPGTGDEGGEGG